MIRVFFVFFDGVYLNCTIFSFTEQVIYLSIFYFDEQLFLHVMVVGNNFVMKSLIICPLDHTKCVYAYHHVDSLKL